MSNTPANNGLDFSDLGGTPIAPAQATAQSSGIDFSDLGGKPIATAVTGQTTPAKGILSELGDTATNVGTGFVKGMGDTVSGVSHILNKIPVIGETLAPSAGISALDQMDVSHGTAEAAGKGLEGMAEFAAGDELLEGLSKGARLVALAKKYPLIAETMALAKEHPILAKIITGGTKGAVVGGVEGGLKGASSGSALQGAKTGAELGAATGAVVPAVIDAATAVPDTARAVASKFTGSDIQPALKSGIQDVWNAVADKAGVTRPTAPSVQDLGNEVADNILARSKANYKLIDDATAGRFSGTEQALKAVNQDLRSVTNDAEEQALLTRKTRLELQLDQLFDNAESKGVDKNVIKAAKSDFKQAQAIYDTNHQIRMSTTGVRPGMQGGEEVPEEINAKSLMNRLNKLFNKGRLQQAVGDDNAEDLIGHSAIAQKAAKDVARNKTVAKTAAGVVGVPAVGTAVVEGVRKILE